MSDTLYSGEKCTGRTTRMLEEARALAHEGYAVYVLCATQNHAKMLKDVYPDLDALGVKFENGHEIPQFDPFTGKLERSWPSVKVLVDHAYAEQKALDFYKVFKAWDNYARAYDKPE